SPTSQVDLVAKGIHGGLARGWFYDRTKDLFQSDRQGETVTPDELVGQAAPGSEITFTVVPRGAGVRLGIDRDLDGLLDRDELDGGTNPADPLLRPKVLTISSNVAVGTDLLLSVQLPPLPAPLSGIIWRQD